MFVERAGDTRPLVKQLDQINRVKKKVAVESQHFEKIYKITKNTAELRDMQKRVMASRQNFLNFGVQNF